MALSVFGMGLLVSLGTVHMQSKTQLMIVKLSARHSLGNAQFPQWAIALIRQLIVQITNRINVIRIHRRDYVIGKLVPVNAYLKSVQMLITQYIKTMQLVKVIQRTVHLLLHQQIIALT